MKTTLLTLFTLFLSTIGYSQIELHQPIDSVPQEVSKIDSQRIDSLLTLLEEHNKFMGSVAVSYKYTPIYSKTVGYTDIKDSLKANDETRYRVGTISNMFTAVLILKAVEEDRLSLDQNIKSYFPNIKNASFITIKNLMNHSSGIYDFVLSTDYLTWNTVAQSKKEMLQHIGKGPILFEPGQKSDYSNSNYVLLSFILEDTYDESYADILNNKIIQPLHLTNTFYGGKINVAKNEAESYKFLGNWKKEPETDVSITQGAGALVSTPKDLNTFMGVLFWGRILCHDTLDLMLTLNNGYGLGIFKYPYEGKIGYGHTGGINGFQSITTYFPKDRLAISMIANAVNYDKNEVLLEVLNSFYNDKVDIPHFKEVEPDPKGLLAFVGTYTSKEIPIKITISKEKNTLIAKGTGQSAYPLEEVSENNYRYDPAGVEIDFNPKKHTFILKQLGTEYKFKRR